MSKPVGHDICVRQLVPAVIQLANDPVANVRFNVAKALQKMVAHLEANVINTQIKPCLERMKNDQDYDVQFYAMEALDGK